MRRNSSSDIIQGLSVEVGYDFERSLRQFSRLVQNSGILRESRDRQTYTVRSEKKQIAKKQAISRWKKQQSLRGEVRPKRKY